MIKTCSIDTCTGRVVGRGWCRKHYSRWYAHGDPRVLKTARGMTDHERLRHHGWIISSTGCWEWSGGSDSCGYGRLRNEAGVKASAHRLAYETWVGPIPAGHVVRHKCDNPPCINPEHLEIGTQQENIQDMISKGRDRKATGVRHGNAVLTLDNLADIHWLLGLGARQKDVASIMNVSTSTISNVARFRTYVD